jgi:hypothetical protein
MAQQYALPNKNNRVALQAPPRTATPAQAVPVPVVPAGPTPGDPRGLTAFIREVAAKYNVSPEVALRVAKSEGLGSFQSGVFKNGVQEPSYGAFQLYTGGGLGNEFQKATGLDPSDPKNEKATIDYALKHASTHGWGPWYGAKNTGIGEFEGISGRGGDAAAAAPIDPTPNVGSGESGYANTITAKTGEDDDGKDDKKKKKSKSEAYGEAFGEALGGIGENYAKSAKNTGASAPTTVPAASLPTPMGPVSMVDPKMIEMQRQQLAMAMQRLNSRKLY